MNERRRITLVKVASSGKDEYGQDVESEEEVTRDAKVYFKNSGGEDLVSGSGSAEFVLNKVGLDGLKSNWKIRYDGSTYDIEHFYPEGLRNLRIIARFSL